MQLKTCNCKHEAASKTTAVHPTNLRGCPHGVMVKVMDCGIVEREFVLQSRSYVHFRSNILGKGMNPTLSFKLLVK